MPFCPRRATRERALPNRAGAASANRLGGGGAGARGGVEAEELADDLEGGGGVEEGQRGHVITVPGRLAEEGGGALGIQLADLAAGQGGGDRGHAQAAHDREGGVEGATEAVVVEVDQRAHPQ